MKPLTDRNWLTKYSPESGDLVADFYIPALECAVRYDRSTGYFSAYALALAARGIEGLVRNRGRMRLVVGCTLKPQDVAAIQQGADLRDRVEAALLEEPLGSDDATAVDALGLLAWMVAKGHLEVKVAVPCDEGRRPIAGLGLFHEKAGILEDAAGNRLAFSGSINETEFGWKHNWDSFHVFTTWGADGGGGTAHVQAEEDSFQRLWADKTASAIVMDVPAAVRLELLKFLPKPESRVSLVNPSGGSCGRTDSLLGDDLFWPRFAPLRAALRHDVRPRGAVGLRTALRRMARRRVGCALHTACAASRPRPLRPCGGTHAPTPTGGRSASLRSPCLAETTCRVG